MAFKIVKYGAPNYADNYYEFICDSADDIENLPTASKDVCAGSIAEVLSSTPKQYRMNTEGEWVAMPEDKGEVAARAVSNLFTIGLFASRPVDTQDYSRVYVASDKESGSADRVTLLPAGEDGSVSAKWISL